jgi:hypothetical protein
MTVLNKSWVWIALLVVWAETAIADTRYDIVPTPSWVSPAALPPEKSTHEAEGGASALYILVDRQVRLDVVQSDYSRFITRLAMSGGWSGNRISTSISIPKSKNCTCIPCC